MNVLIELRRTVRFEQLTLRQRLPAEDPGRSLPRLSETPSVARCAVDVNCVAVALEFCLAERKRNCQPPQV